MEHKRRNARQNLFSFGGTAAGGSSTAFEQKSYSRKTPPTYQPNPSYNKSCYPSAAGYQDEARQLVEIDTNTPKFFGRSDLAHPTSHYANHPQHSAYSRTTAVFQSGCKCACQQTKLPRDLSQDKFTQKLDYFYNPSIEEISRKYGIQPKIVRPEASERSNLNQQPDIFITPRQEVKELQTRAKSHAKFESRPLKTLPIQESESFEARNTSYNISNHYSKQTEGLRSRLKTEIKEPATTQFYVPLERSSDTRAEQTLLSINDLSERINQKVNKILSQCQDY